MHPKHDLRLDYP